MSKPIYKMYLLKFKEAGYQLSLEERNNIIAKTQESFQSVGAEMVISCDTIWSSEPWLSFGVQKYPNIEAVQEHAAQLMQFEWYRYVDAMTILGTESESQE